MCIMFMPMIPAGLEGSLFALITTWENTAAEVGYDIGTFLECIFPVSNASLENGHWGHLIALTWITSICQCLPVLFVYFEVESNGVVLRALPDGVKETKEQASPGNKSSEGATAFFVLL